MSRSTASSTSWPSTWAWPSAVVCTRDPSWRGRDHRCAQLSRHGGGERVGGGPTGRGGRGRCGWLGRVAPAGGCQRNQRQHGRSGSQDSRVHGAVPLTAIPPVVACQEDPRGG
jgi:hypothetical protein